MAFKLNLECTRVNGDKNQETVHFQAVEPKTTKDNPHPRRGSEQLTVTLKSTDKDFRKFVPGGVYPVTVGE